MCYTFLLILATKAWSDQNGILVCLCLLDAIDEHPTVGNHRVGSVFLFLFVFFGGRLRRRQTHVLRTVQRRRLPKLTTIHVMPRHSIADGLA